MASSSMAVRRRSSAEICDSLVRRWAYALNWIAALEGKRSVVSESRGGGDGKVTGRLPEQCDHGQAAELNLHPLREEEVTVLRRKDVVEDGSETEVVDEKLLESKAGEAVDAEHLSEQQSSRSVHYPCRVREQDRASMDSQRRSLRSMPSKARPSGCGTC